MLALKYGHQLCWADLQYVENPLVAKLTLKSNHGVKVGGDYIQNACEHNLPDERTRSFDPYGQINQRLENGQVFLVNSNTTNPLFTKLGITEHNTAKWEILQCQCPYMENSVDAVMQHITVPKVHGVLRQEAKEAPAVVHEEPVKEEEKKEEKPEYRISIGIQGAAGVGSSDVRVVASDFESKIKIKNVEKPFGKIELDSSHKQFNGHREVALVDIDEGEYFSFIADNEGRGAIPLGPISTLEKETDADFKTALAAVTLMGYEDHTCDTSKPMPLRNGYVYIYLNGYLWREIHVDNKGKYKDVNLSDYISKDGYRRPTHHFDRTVLLPAKINGETPKIQIAFSQCQWTWQRIRQLGGMDPEDMRLKDHLDADVSPLDGSDERRDKRMGAELDLSAWQEGMESSGDKNILALDGWVDQFESKDDLVDDNNLDKQVGVLFLPETLHWANKAALDHQLAWANFEEFLDDLKNPKHTDPAKKEEFKFAPYFDSAVLAHQYFFAENDDMKKYAKESLPPKKRYRGPRRYSSNNGLEQAIKLRTKWADQLSLPDIERALGMQKRAALRDRILEEKKKLIEVLDPSDSNRLSQLKEEIADFATLDAREDKNQDWAYDQLWALVGKLLDKLARLPAMQDNGLDSKPLTMGKLNEAHVNDVGHQFVFSILDNQHWLYPIIFPKADSSDASLPLVEEKSLTDYTCDPDKLKPKIDRDRDFEIVRRTAELVSGAFLAFMDTSAGKIGDAHIQSTVRLIHSQNTGLKIEKFNASLGQVMQPQLKAVGLDLDIPDLPEGMHLIRTKFNNDSQILNTSENELFRKAKPKKNGVDLPNSKEFATATIKNAKGNVIGAVARDLIESGHGLNPRAWQALSKSKWHTSSADVWVLNDQQSLINKVDEMKPVIKSSILPMLAVVELWSISRAIGDFRKQENLLDDPMLLANCVSAVMDASALAIDAVRIFQQYSHSKVAYAKGVRVWDKFLMSQKGYANLFNLARALNVAAAGVSAIISGINAINNAIEGDDAWVSHSVMSLGFLFLGGAAIASSTILLMTGLGLVLLGAVLLKWVFKENDLMEQWLEFGPFAKQDIDVRYLHGGGRMKSEPRYIIDTDYGKLRLDKNKRLQAVLDVGDFDWDGTELKLTKKDPLDQVDGVNEILVGKLGGPVKLDSLANKSQRLAKNEYKVVDDWRNSPITSAKDLASLIYKPELTMEELPDLSIHNQVRDIKVNCDLKGIVTSKAKVQVQLWLRHKAVNRHKQAKMEKLGSPDEIIQLNGHEVQFVWKNIPVDQYNRYLAKAKVDLYGDGSLTVPGRYDDDGWLEEWL